MEYAVGIRSHILNSLRTFLRSQLPWQFWSQLQMAHAIRKRRIALYVLWLPILLLLLAIVIQIGTAVYVHQTMIEEINLQTQDYQDELAFYKQGPMSYEEWSAHVDDDKVEKYLEFLKGHDDWVATRIPQIESYLASPPVIQFSKLQAAWEAVSRPFSRSSNGAIIYGGVNYPYAPPVEIHWYALTQAGIDLAETEEPILFVLPAVVFNAAVALLFPLTFVLLPVSRRRAKVQWKHVFRVAAYSVHIPYGMFAASFVFVLLIGFGASGMVRESLTIAIVSIAILCAIMLILWWWMALRFYLKIPHSFAVSLLLAVMLYLATPVLIACIAFVLGE
jgi:hypothetical protein